MVVVVDGAEARRVERPYEGADRVRALVALAVATRVDLVDEGWIVAVQLKRVDTDDWA